ncbi:PA0069 family radical SAM protein [Persicimonas caeni]|uniref:PA0069 family radical SAM protein n=1 Tax=Persicimonas caeni TaxID=2292766 RepID=A0A4Y6PP10_PERCE|nr:PA0069 family radical SAM protein [Persicimonas caeni]QDG50068.1 PA0069 family radical SAM protein [Persicimonas caeni]QED31289.1 PA0069 family radical SAM protein [Persicimonas caeni]
MKQVDNPPNPWSSTHVEWLGEPPEAELCVYEEQARSILTKNNSPDIPFCFGVNPYRGCYHGCAYCYARPTHQYLDFGAGTDFERKIIVKTNAADLLLRAFEKPGWEREPVAFSGITDCYQPLEASYGITRKCLEVCAKIGNPVAIVTKGSLIRRDVDVLERLNEEAGVHVYVSIPFADDEFGWAVEPHASAISQRFRTIQILSEAGITTGVAIAPIIPGLNDSDVPTILERAAELGATRAFMTLLRLPAEVLPVFEGRIRQVMPDRADKILNTVRDVRQGKLNESQFGGRMVGKGPRWKIISKLFETQCKRLGLNARQGAGVATELEKRGPLQQRLF